VTAIGAFTVTKQNAVLLPSTVVAVMVAVPTLRPAISAPVDQLSEKPATAALLVDQVTPRLVAFGGVMVGYMYQVFPPTARVMDELFNVTPVTATEAVTATAQVAVLLLPSTVVAVMVALPALRPVMYAPVDQLFDMVATDASLVDQVTPGLVAFEGAMDVYKYPSEPPTARFRVERDNVTPVTAIGAVTVTEQVAVLLLPSTAVAVMVAVPTARPDMYAPVDQLSVMVATAALLVDQVTLGLLAFAGAMIVFKYPSEPPTARFRVD